jgi:hypothetical protein
VPVPSKEIEQSCILILRVSIFATFSDFFYWILELYQQCGIFWFFILYLKHNVIIQVGFNVTLQ